MKEVDSINLFGDIRGIRDNTAREEAKKSREEAEKAKELALSATEKTLSASYNDDNETIIFREGN